MKRQLASLPVFLASSLLLFVLASCGPAVAPIATNVAQNATATPPAPGSSDCPPENWPCASDSMTLTADMAPTLDTLSSGTQISLTAAMGATLAAIPSNTPPAGATFVPVAGDLGWGAVFGVIRDGTSGLPIEGATVECEHYSYTSPYPCKGITTTNEAGIYSFTEVYFHDTDKITLIVEAPGYTPLRFEQPGFTFPELHADLGLFPVGGEDGPTAMPVMCTPIACSDGVLVCGSGDMCPLGCGAVCMPFTPTP